MSTIQEVWSFLSNEVWPHWMGIAYALVLSVVAQVLKTRLFTATMAAKYKWVFWTRRVYPLALLVLSVVVGIIAQGEVAPGVDTVGKRILYFCAMACVSMVGFNIVKQWVKKKYDVDISIGEVNKS
jgi:hypothetical protein